MNMLEIIKKEIQNRYKTNPDIHINVTITRPKVNLKNEPVRIKKVYPHVFQIEEKSTGFLKTHTLQYSDILLNQIEIIELKDIFDEIIQDTHPRKRV